MAIDTAKYKDILDKRLAFLTRRVDKIEDEFSKSGDAPYDGDDGTGRSLAVLDDMDELAATEARAIHAALDRIDTGTFGECVTCGEEIDTARLDAVPHTPFCKIHAP